jgi:hypothetical protein
MKPRWQIVQKVNGKSEAECRNEKVYLRVEAECADVHGKQSE